MEVKSAPYLLCSFTYILGLSLHYGMLDFLLFSNKTFMLSIRSEKFIDSVDSLSSWFLCMSKNKQERLLSDLLSEDKITV